MKLIFILGRSICVFYQSMFQYLIESDSMIWNIDFYGTLSTRIWIECCFFDFRFDSDIYRHTLSNISSTQKDFSQSEVLNLTN
ncbi:hypothetical protein C462_05388 [Halorubrum distributum JCM 13916]|uniref:Uncharacterized protein n=1 Tax=Halorubrum distributum JCM 13916 TaxID=1230455 RepID=M0PQB1_9EURY|nr:hypothetical protein C462_05388 [Halorubrum arcis JCM 13916]